MSLSSDLNKRVLIQRKVSVRDEYGQTLDEWESIADTPDGKVWGRISYISGLQTIKAGADVSIVKASIRIRRRSDVDAGMRVLHGDSVFDVKAVLPSVSDRCIDLVCEVVQ